MFEELLNKAYQRNAEFNFELSKTLDPYRLKHLLSEQIVDIQQLYADVTEMVTELEDNNNV